MVNEGGSRSSKTYSIAQKYVIKMLQSKGNVLTIARKTMPALKATAMRDFFEIISNMGYYREEDHNKSDHVYLFNGNLVEFVSMDQPQKKRGAKRNWLWLNEANEFTFEDYMQMAMRTTNEITLDYNPSDEFHWIYEKVVPRKDCTFIHSTYLDNPFVEQSVKDEIEYLKDVDENYWRIYGLGLRGQGKTKILSNWDIVADVPANYDDVVFGMDFGFNNPSCLIACYLHDGEITVDELIYQSHLINYEFIMKGKDIIPEEWRETKLFKADSAEPDRIQEWANAGFICIPCKKGKNSVKDGIDKLKMVKIHFTARSVNAIKEAKNWQWKVDKEGRVLDEEVPFNNHAMAALRYAIATDSEEEKINQIDTVVDETIEHVKIGDY